MKNILVAVDFSAITQKLLEAAVRVANEDSKVYIIHVAAPDPDFVGYSVGPEYIRDDRADTLHEEHEKLGEFKTSLKSLGVDAEALLVSGPTVETLLDEIKKLEIDFLIIGKKGHSKIHELIMGSVCKNVLSKVEVPMLVIPQPAH
jgi:nucleotide-binding universal stress UspA family protein